MTLYQIDQAILEAIERGTDPETGEMTNADELMQLQMAVSRSWKTSRASSKT